MQILPQPSGYLGVLKALLTMRGLVNRAQIHPLIRKQAAIAISGCARHDWVCKAYAIQGWVQDHVQFVHDTTDHEHLTDPIAFATAIERGQRPFGDCDDFSMYAAAMMKAIGMRPSFKIVGNQGRWHHVLVHVNGVDVDATKQPWGGDWAPPEMEQLYAI